jgi:hypothetical protein
MTESAGTVARAGIELRPAAGTTAARTQGRAAAAGSLGLRVGDWIEVRSLDEILATLDEDSALDGLPFMPEMVQYCGRRFRVYKSAHKTCDTIEHYVIRRMQNAVHLEGLRCDGESHGDCQAGCLLFWKEAWLKRVEGSSGQREAEPATFASGTEADVLRRATRAPGSGGGAGHRYRCQATELLRATSEVRRRERWDPRFYVRDLTSGNVSLRDFLRYGLLAAVNAFMLRWRGRRYPHVCGLAGKQTPTAAMNLRAGELVRIRPEAEIMRTLNSGQRNRGLWFDVEMLPHCGSEQRVLRRVERIVDEKTGKLIHFQQPCVILDGVTCNGNLSTHRMFCPRAVYPYWREIWLERVDAVDDRAGTDAGSPESEGSQGFREPENDSNSASRVTCENLANPRT